MWVVVGVSARERNHILHPTSPQLSSTWCTDNTCTRVRWNMHSTNEYHLDSSPIAMFPQPARFAPRPASRAFGPWRSRALGVPAAKMATDVAITMLSCARDAVKGLPVMLAKADCKGGQARGAPEMCLCVSACVSVCGCHWLVPLKKRTGC
jgi:hypothetical protein